MKSTSYPPPNDKHNSSSFRSLALGKLFKPTALSLLIASLALPALSQARDYNNSDLDEKSVLFSLNDDAEDIGNIDLSIEANARNSFYVMTVLGSEKTLDDNALNLQDVRVSLISKGIDKSFEEGTYVLHADQYGQVNILGDIDIAVVHGEEPKLG